jgi:subtilisin-like proprotein convertase family protein
MQRIGRIIAVAMLAGMLASAFSLEPIGQLPPVPVAQAANRTFLNGAPISIPDSSKASPYPSSISVTGLPSTITKVTVTLNNLSHSYPDDLDILLVGPTGATTMLMSDAGGGFGISSVKLTFDAASAVSPPNSTQIVAGTYRPGNFGANDPFSAPAPSGPYGETLSVFNGTAPGGIWQLYIVDDDNVDSGVLSGGWSLSIETTETTATAPPPDKEDAPRWKTEEQRQQERHTNTSNRSDVVTEGNVLSVESGPDGLVITIGNVDGPVTIVLRCGSSCPTVRPGDYVEVDGEKIHEFLYEADGINVVK